MRLKIEETNYYYNEKGNLLCDETNYTSVNHYIYDTQDKLIGKLTPNFDFEKYIYDNEYLSHTIISNDNKVIDSIFHRYDSYGRLISSVGDKHSTYYEYNGDLLSTKTEVTANDITTHHYLSYDKKENLTHERICINTSIELKTDIIKNIHYEYDITGKLIKKDTENDSIYYQYNKNNQLILTVTKLGLRIKYSYNKHGWLINKIIYKHI